MNNTVTAHASQMVREDGEKSRAVRRRSPATSAVRGNGTRTAACALLFKRERLPETSRLERRRCSLLPCPLRLSWLNCFPFLSWPFFGVNAGGFSPFANTSAASRSSGASANVIKKLVSYGTAPGPGEDEGEEFLLAGHHDLPAELQDQATAPHEAEQEDGFYFRIEFEKLCGGSLKDSSSPASPQRLNANYRAPLELWAGVDKEETKKQRQNEYLRYRRLFMDIEREQVKEQQRQKERQKRIATIKSKKENQRRAEERRMQEMAQQQGPCSGERACEILAQLELEEKRLKKMKEKQQRNKEYTRYVEALRAQMREKIQLCNIDLPPLCSCGSDFWDSHPDTCANNCVFYKNHKAYSQALQSVVSSCDLAERNSAARLPLRDFAALRAAPPAKRL
ncbi:coiled-coil domain-containing protein 15 isoform X3 [Apteryx rowi]|uniref:coiled-coil domain-containing protein 15 isoform X3 n=1 Tax=Apteryx rowi TaxID=308060 RepID=UPI000E1C8F97|nr:coiled-coil domain-containing protein 15 isoform X3 [Apteryx rowi]